jgi:hypothetical protein
MRRVVQVEFNPWDQRSYDYWCDDDNVLIDDKVVVTTKRGEVVATIVGVKAESDRVTTAITRKATQEDLAR